MHCFIAVAYWLNCQQLTNEIWFTNLVIVNKISNFIGQLLTIQPIRNDSETIKRILPFQTVLWFSIRKKVEAEIILRCTKIVDEQKYQPNFNGNKNMFAALPYVRIYDVHIGGKTRT